MNFNGKRLRYSALEERENKVKLNIGILRYVSVSDEVRDGLRVARRSRSGSDVRDCASRKSRMNASMIR